MISIAVFGSSATTAGSSEWDEAITLGRGIAVRGWTLVTGGYGGAMEAASHGAASASGRVVGVTAPTVFPARPGVNPHVGEEIAERTLSRRIATLVESTDAAVALPGSIGTLAEMMVAWNEAFVAPFRNEAPRPVVAIGPVWRTVVETVESHIVTGAGLVRLVPDAEAALATLDATMRHTRHQPG